MSIRSYRRRGFSLRNLLRGFKLQTQVVMSEPSKVLVEKYNTKSGQEKNRYRKNLNSKHVKVIIHKLRA